MTMEWSDELSRMLSGSTLPLYERAVVFATVVHQGTTRKGSRIPYLSHPLEAAAIVSEMTDDQEVIAAAVLHDVVEDTDATLEDIEAYFGKRVAEYVADESENKRKELPPESTWVIRKQETIDFLTQKADRKAKMLALGDKLSNLRSIARDSAYYGEAFWERFHQKDKSMHGWLYRQVAKAVEELQEFEAWQEYNWLIAYVFQEK